MDPRVKDKLDGWEFHIEALAVVEAEFLALESQEKPMWASLFRQAVGRTLMDREAEVHASSDWRAFQAGLVASKVAYHKQRRLLEVRQAEYQATYLQSKHDNSHLERV